MYNISKNYKDYIETKTALTPKSKIVVEGVEYDSSVIKTAPKLSHKNSKMIGGFPTKTCSFEIYDFNNNLNFVGKEVYVYRGLVINGKIEYIPQGVFIPTEDKITTNIAQKTISFNEIQDKSQLFDVPYVNRLDWSKKHTGLEIMQDMCGFLNVELATLDFPWASYEFEQPNFSTSISCREVASRFAEIGGCVAIMDYQGKCLIKEPTITNHIIERKRYLKPTKEKTFGPINTVVLGMDGIDNDIYYPEKLPENKVEWKIVDNPFVDLNPKGMIEEVSKYILGKSIIPFSLKDFVDGFYFELNDIIEVKDRDGNTFKATILNYETTSRIKSNISAEVQNNIKTNYNLAGSSKSSLRDVKISVNHIENQIELLSEEIVEISNTVSGVGTLDLPNCSDTPLYKLTIRNACQLFFSKFTFFSSNTFFKSNNLILECGGEETKFKLPPLALRELNGVYDEMIIENQVAKVIKRIGYNAEDGSLYLLDEPVETDLGEVIINPKKGTNKMRLESFPRAYLEVTYLLDNELTNTFTNKVESRAEIKLASDEINLSVQRKLEGVVDEGGNVTSASIILAINNDGSGITINADKIDIKANDVLNLLADNAINLTSKNITIEADNLSIDANGNLVCNSGTFNNATVNGTINSNNGKIGGWTINDAGLTNGSVFIRNDGYSTIYTASDLFILRAILQGESWATVSSETQEFYRYDLNHDGVVNSADLLILRQMLNME